MLSMLRSTGIEWACFSSQQGAEKAVKAVYLHLHGEGWGHSVLKLLRGLADQADIPESLLDAARGLGQTLYPHPLSQRF